MTGRIKLENVHNNAISYIWVHIYVGRMQDDLQE